MRPPRGPLGPGAFLLIAAMVVVPEIIRQCKPLAKTIGETVVKIGEGIQHLAGEDEPTAAHSEGAPAATGTTQEATEVAEGDPEVSVGAQAPPPQEGVPKPTAGRKRQPRDEAAS